MVDVTGAAASVAGPAPLPGLGASLLNMPLQEQLKLMQQGGALPVAAPLVLNGAAGGVAGSSPPSPSGAAGRKKPQRGSVARPSAREPTKGTTSSSNRPLSSKFRGVCWNRKNKRWQAAINSGGKYLYLGSYIEEDEAAMAFDRAAIKLRGRKGKLNFTYEDYVDSQGNLKEDIHLPDSAKDGAPKDGGASKAGAAAKRGKGGRGGAGGGADAGGVGGAGVGVGVGVPVTSAPLSGGGIFSSGLSSLSMEDVKRLLSGNSGAAPPPLMGAGAPDRGVTTGFVGALPSASAALAAGPFGLAAAAGGGTGAAGTSAFAAAAGGLGPDLPLHLPDLALSGPSGLGGLQQQQQQQPQQLDGAAGGHPGWGAVLQSFRPIIEAELGEGRAIQQLVEPQHAGGGGNGSNGGGGAGASLIKGVVYSQAAGGGLAYGAALWDGARLVDHGTKPNLESALETATSLAAGEEDLQGDAALRDLLGGPSALVPRATSLALFQALGSLRAGDLPSLDLGDLPIEAPSTTTTAAAAAAAMSEAGASACDPPGTGSKRTRGGGGKGGKGGKRARRGQGDEDDVAEQQQQQQQQLEQQQQQFASTAGLAKTGLADMLKNLAGMQQVAQ